MEQRRHQRIRFNVQPLVRIGQAGTTGMARLENLSPGGLMVRTDRPLNAGEALGCEFSVSGAVMIDLSATVVSHLGDLYCARLHGGPISERLINDEIARSLSSGGASVLSVNEVQGRRVMRVAGGLNGSLRNDFMHGLIKVGVDEIDVSAVTDIDHAGVELCRVAAQDHGVGIVGPSRCSNQKLAAIAGWATA